MAQGRGRGADAEDGHDMPAVPSTRQLLLPGCTRNLRLVPDPQPMLSVSAPPRHEKGPYELDEVRS